MAKMVILVFLIFLMATGNAQFVTPISNADSFSITLSRAEFETLVDSCTWLLKSKKITEISDSGHIYIILCKNTIFYSRKNKSVKKRFEGDKFENYSHLLNDSGYVKKLGDIYTDWQTNKGMGIYFPQLQIEFGGQLHRHSLINVIE